MRNSDIVLVPVRCSVCGHDHIAKRGKTGLGKQRYLCQKTKCPVKTFILDYDDHGCVPNVKKKIIDMAMNGSGIRDTTRVLGISPTTVINELKKGKCPRMRESSRTQPLESA